MNYVNRLKFLSTVLNTLAVTADEAEQAEIQALLKACRSVQISANNADLLFKTDRRLPLSFLDTEQYQEERDLMMRLRGDVTAVKDSVVDYVNAYLQQKGIDRKDFVDFYTNKFRDPLDGRQAVEAMDNFLVKFKEGLGGVVDERKAPAPARSVKSAYKS